MEEEEEDDDEEEGAPRLAFRCGAPSREEMVKGTILVIGRVEGVRRAAGPRVPLVLTAIRCALGGVGFLRDHVRSSEAEAGEVEGRGKEGLAPPSRRRLT